MTQQPFDRLVGYMQSMMVRICKRSRSIIGSEAQGGLAWRFCHHLPVFQMFHEVIVHKSLLDQLTRPANTLKRHHRCVCTCTCVCTFLLLTLLSWDSWSAWRQWARRGPGPTVLQRWPVSWCAGAHQTWTVSGLPLLQDTSKDCAHSLCHLCL